MGKRSRVLFGLIGLFLVVILVAVAAYSTESTLESRLVGASARHGFEASVEGVTMDATLELRIASIRFRHPDTSLQVVLGGIRSRPWVDLALPGRPVAVDVDSVRIVLPSCEVPRLDLRELPEWARPWLRAGEGRLSRAASGSDAGSLPFLVRVASGSVEGGCDVGRALPLATLGHVEIRRSSSGTSTVSVDGRTIPEDAGSFSASASITGNEVVDLDVRLPPAMTFRLDDRVEAQVGGLRYRPRQGLELSDVLLRARDASGIALDAHVGLLRADLPSGLAGDLHDIRMVDVQGLSADIRLPTDSIVDSLEARRIPDGSSPTGGGPSLASVLGRIPRGVSIRSGSIRVFLGHRPDPFVLADSLELRLDPAGVPPRLEVAADLRIADSPAIAIQGRAIAEPDGSIRADLEAPDIDLGGTLQAFGIDLPVREGRLAGAVRCHHPASFGGTLDCEGTLATHAVRVQHPKLSPMPIEFDGFEAAWQGSWTAGTEAASVTAQFLAPTGAHATLGVRAAHLHHGPEVTVRLEFPEQPCGPVADAIPRGLLPTLGPWLKLSGTVNGMFEVGPLSPNDWYGLNLVIEGDMDRCRIESLGASAEQRMSLLKRSFSLAVDEGEGSGRVRVGPREPGYLPLSRLDRVLQHGPILSEDGEFTVHKGFSRRLLEAALRLDLATGRYAYGGSTLTQQLVKNLFVGRTKTLARKLEEAFITVAAERELGKDRILELYLNCIEYGKDLYGIDNAARFYFGISATDLTPVQIAFLMHLKPWPKLAWKWARTGTLPQVWRDGIHKRMSDMVKFGYLDEADLAAAFPYDPIAESAPDTPCRQLGQDR